MDDTRFVTIDNFVKALCELTGCEVVLEDAVKDGARIDCGVSDKSRVNYLKLRTAVKLFLLEGKTNKTLSEHSICQLVGYYMATSLETPTLPPLDDSN